MATAPLVENDLERGAALIAALQGSAVPVDFVAWSYSNDDEEWRLIIATPLVQSEGRVVTYERIREVLADDPWLDPGVGRVVLVSPEDPAVERFRKLAQAPITEDLATQGERGVIRGRPVDASYVYNMAALRFEEEVLDALRRLAPPSAVLRRGGKVFESPREVDFVLDSGRGMVLVEAKSTNRSMTARELLSMRLAIPSDVPLLVISRSGFTNEVGVAGSPNRLFLATWRSRADDGELKAALEAALA